MHSGRILVVGLPFLNCSHWGLEQLFVLYLAQLSIFDVEVSGQLVQLLLQSFDLFFIVGLLLLQLVL